MFTFCIQDLIMVKKIFLLSLVHKNEVEQNKKKQQQKKQNRKANEISNY